MLKVKLKIRSKPLQTEIRVGDWVECVVPPEKARYSGGAGYRLGRKFQVRAITYAVGDAELAKLRVLWIEETGSGVFENSVRKIVKEK